MTFKALPGVFDILPSDPLEPWKSSFLWNYLENEIRTLASEYGFREIRTPIFEKTELFSRGVGETSDIVTKEMYTFEDRGGRSTTLRPEGTAPVIRAFLEHQIQQQGTIHKYFYICPMFRYERSQAGRYRQHHQFGVESFGSVAPETDAEVIDLLYTLYQRLGIKDLTVNLNSIGTKSCRGKYREALKDYLHSHISQLSKESQARFEKNPLRILDSKDPTDQQIIGSAPNILDYLNEESKVHFEQVQNCLRELKIPFEINPLLVRGLDYYNKTVFEIISTSLGAQNSIGGGGRYDGLMKELGGPDIPSCGFGTGLERVLQTMLTQKVPLPNPPHTTLFLIPLGEAAKNLCFLLQKKLRSARIPTEMDTTGRKLNKVMGYADQIRATYVAVIGDEEIKTKLIPLKEMTTGTVYNVPFDNIQRILQVESHSEEFIMLWKEMERPFEGPMEAEFFIKKIHQSIQETSQLTLNLQNALEQMQKALEQKP